MINAYHIVEALPAIVAGMVALWAAGSTWHWFIRTSVIIAGLLALLLIPAYELVITFGTEMLTVVAGMRFWQRRRAQLESVARECPSLRKSPQISLKSLMLATVVVAVFVAVMARFPSLNWFQWMSRAGSGLIAAILTLLCAWLVLGKAHRLIRVAAAILIWLVTAFGISLFELFGYAIWYWASGSANIVEYMLKPESQAWMWDRSQYWMSTLAIAMPVLCTWIYLWMRTGWYSPFSKLANLPVATPSLARRSSWIRGTFITFSLAALILPLYLFWRLSTPPPYSQERTTMASGYRELIEAAEMIDESSATRLMQYHRMSTNALTVELAPHDPAIEWMRRAFSHPAEYERRTINDEEQDAGNLIWVVGARLELACRLKSLPRKIEASMDWLKLMDIFMRDRPELGQLYIVCQDNALRTLWECRQQLSREQTKELIIALAEFDRRRVLWLRIEEHLNNSHRNAGWESHLQSLLDDWTGYDRFLADRLNYLSNVALLRVLICDLAIQAFRDEHNRFPNRLDELVPEYLPSVPVDPFLEAPLIYRVESDAVTLYSVGPNLRDDGGKAFDANTNESDIVADSLFSLPVPATAAKSSVSSGSGVPSVDGGDTSDSVDADRNVN